MYKRSSGFTIIELVVVISVIAILATITVVAYRGVQDRATKAAVLTDLKQTAKQLEVYKASRTNNTAYPTTLSQADISPTTTTTYSYTTTTNPAGYCLTATSTNRPSIAYSLNNTTETPAEGGTACATGDTSVIASSENLPNEGKLKLFDGTSTTKWLAFSPTAWITFSLVTGATPTSYSLTSANDTPTRDPRTWTLYGSNDRSTWVPIDSRSAQTFSNRFVTNTYTITNAEAYRHFKLDVTQNNGDSLFQLAELSISTSSGPAAIINQ